MGLTQPREQIVELRARRLQRRGATGGRERHRLRNGLVVSQITLAMVLLIGSGLMMRSFMALRAVDPGFDPAHVLTARLSLPEAEVADWRAVEQFFDTARMLDVVIRATADPVALVPALRDRVRALNPRIPIANPRAMTDVFDDATARTSFTAAMLGAASGIALLLGLVGIYGVISYVVSQRTREIGVRMALGASGAKVRGMVVRQSLALSGAGVALGLVAAALLSRLLGSLLYGVGAIDPLTYLVIALALISAAVLASLIPAIRAASVDPSRALRAE